MAKRGTLRDLELAEREAARLFETWKLRRRRVARYIEPTVQLLQREGYFSSSVSMGACDLVAVNSDHLLLGLVSISDWPTAEEIEMFQNFPSPLGTRKIVFRWHGLGGIPDRKQLASVGTFR
jgi:hypothetical protein